MAGGYFITGTDTDSGKTLITLGLMHRLQSRGLQVAGLKPVAAGAEQTADGLRNGDALQLQAQASRPAAYGVVNPYCYQPPIAPHLAAERIRQNVDFSMISRCYAQLAATAERVLVEGAGGWLVPLGAGRTMADLAVALNLPVILVVGLRLGCINHALLSVESIRARGLTLAGWVGNQIDPSMAEFDANIDTLRNWLESPCLGVVPYLDSPLAASTAEHLLLPESF